MKIETTYGPRFKTHWVVMVMKDDLKRSFQVANPNVFLEKLQEEQLKAGLGNPPIPVTYTPKVNDRIYVKSW